MVWINKKDKEKKMRKIETIKNQNFWGLSMLVLLYINTVLELYGSYLSLKVSEIIIIAILLFVLILIFNEINNVLYDNYENKSLKYLSTNNSFKTEKEIQIRNFQEKKIKKTLLLLPRNKKIYKIHISLI